MYADYLSLGVSALRSMPNLLSAVFAIENGWLVIYPRLEAYTTQRPKMGAYAFGEAPQLERVAAQRIVVGLRFCTDLEAVGAANREAASELERIRTWRKNKDEQGPYGPTLCA